MRAKLKISNLTRHENSLQLHFRAVCANQYPSDGSDENNTFARWTPQAVLSMSITNPILLDSFTLGQEFYVDFTPC